MTFCSWSFFCLHMWSLASFKKSPLRSVLVALAGTKTLFLHPPHPPRAFPADDAEDQAAHADGGLGALQAAAVHRRAGAHGWEGVVGAKLFAAEQRAPEPMLHHLLGRPVCRLVFLSASSSLYSSRDICIYGVAFPAQSLPTCPWAPPGWVLHLWIPFRGDTLRP